MQRKKAFTLVELLIVIVIIGILMTALLPRLVWAQALARDTARQSDIAKLHTAILWYRNLKGSWPSSTSTGTNALHPLVEWGLLTDIPKDPIEQDYQAKINTTQIKITWQNYTYLVIPQKWGSSEAIVLGAKVENESKANYVSFTGNILDLSGNNKEISICNTITQWDTTKQSQLWNYDCTYTNGDQLWYIVKIS